MGPSLVVNIQKHEKRVRILSLLLQVWFTSKVEFLVKASKFNKRSTRDALVYNGWEQAVMIKHGNEWKWQVHEFDQHEKLWFFVNAKILSSSKKPLSSFRFNHIWIPNTDVSASSGRPRGPRPVFRIDLTMTWPWIAEPEILRFFECRIDVIYICRSDSEWILRTGWCHMSMQWEKKILPWKL